MTSFCGILNHSCTSQIIFILPSLSPPIPKIPSNIRLDGESVLEIEPSAVTVAVTVTIAVAVPPIMLPKMGVAVTVDVASVTVSVTVDLAETMTTGVVILYRM